MANIGEEQEEIEVTPISIPVEAPPVPAETPVVTPAEPDPVPA